MVLLSSLYDTSNERYPIFHSAILAFVITVFLPLNIGISKLPLVDVLVLLLTGFFSLFMIVRNDKVGMSLLSHLRIPDRKKVLQHDKQLVTIKKARSNVHESIEPPHYKHDPFVQLQNVVEYIMITHDGHIDLATRERLENMRHELQKITKGLCEF
ncbi:MAG: hypothetical protein E6K91_01665 [Thaumarchaeota archaeon]|nr:MAG: hypothetical protein E6K91_01665 [Nitrososphaerota archaeon]